MDAIWNMMAKHHFETVDELSDELKCRLCYKLLVNACNTPCCCCFCLNCIRTYLMDENKECPGQTENCNETLLDFHRDIQIDRVLNLKISKLVVKCPNFGCQWTTELKSIESHLRICEQQTMACPYFEIGCEYENVNNGAIRDHLMNKIDEHARLAVGYMINVRNEMDWLKKEMEFMKKEIDQLKAQNEELELQRNTRLDEIKSEESEKQSCSPRKEITPNCSQTGFKWIISDWTGLIRQVPINGRKKYIYSDNFLSHHNGYQMCLMMKLDKLELYFGFCIILGPNDDKLKWPFNRYVEFSLMDQRNGRPFKTWSKKCADYPFHDNLFRQVVSGRSKPVFVSFAIPPDQITSSNNVCVDNKVTIKFSVSS